MKKLKLLLAFCALLLGWSNFVSAQTNVTASYIGDLSKIVGGSHNHGNNTVEHRLNQAAYPQGSAWWNDQSLPQGWHAFTAPGAGETIGESWTPGVGSAGVMMGHTMNLPEGNYTLSFKAFGTTASNASNKTASSAGDVVAFCTGQDNVDITNTTVGGNTFHNVSFTFTVTEANSTYSFGIKKVADGGYAEWCQMKDVSLVLNSTNITPIANDVTTGWTQTFEDEGSKVGDFAGNTASIEGNGDGTNFLAPFLQVWKSSGNILSNQTISNTFTPTQTGVYKMSAWVRAVNESGGAVSGIKIFIGDTEADACTGSAITKGRLGTYTAMADGVSGTPISYGFRIQDATINWISWKDVTFTYLGDLPQAEIDALLNQVPTGKMSATVQAELTSKVNDLNTNKSVAAYNALASYISTANASIEAYAPLGTKLTEAASVKSSVSGNSPSYVTTFDTNIGAITSDYNAGNYAESAISTQVAAVETEIIALVKSQTVVGSDMTRIVPNAACTGAAGDDNWKIKNALASGEYFRLDTWAGTASGMSVPMIEYWISNGNTLSSNEMYQTITGLSNGVYRVTAETVVNNESNVAPNAGSALLFANDATTDITTGGTQTSFKGQTGTFTVEGVVSDGSLTLGLKAVSPNYNWIAFKNVHLYYMGAQATSDEKTALADAIAAAEGKTLGFEDGEYAPYENVDALTKLAAAKAIDTETASGAAVVAATTALTGATWTANDGSVECVYNGNFAEGQGSPAANIQQYGWTRTNGWGQFKNDGFESSTAYYNQPGSLQYGNAGVYTMPLKAQTIYRLQFKYAKWDGNFAPTVSVLNEGSGMAAKTFENASSNYKDGYNSVDMVFVTAAAGNYVLSLSASSNYVITGVSITKAASQVLEFADGSVPTYAPGTYPSVKITRTLTAGSWATAVYPFAVSGVDNIAVLDSYDSEGGALAFTAAAASTANVPFFMMSNTDKNEITLSDVAVAAASAEDATSGDASLKGAYSTTNITNAEKNYVLSNNKIFSVGDAGATINPYRAYIQLSEGGGSARALSFVVDGKITGINQIDNGQLTIDNSLPVKRIVNGKLVIEKNGVKYNAAGSKLY